MNTTKPDLLPYQLTAVEWLKDHSNRLLALDMGLGKTAIAITAAEELGLKTWLVIGPAISRLTWAREIKKWAAFPHVVNVMSTSNDKPKLNAINICSYDYVVRNILNFKNMKFDVLIADESHYLKNNTTKRTQNILGMNGVARLASRRWLLTGTPMPNHPFELWPTMATFGATKLSAKQFIEKYCECYWDGYAQRITGAKRNMMPELRKHLDPIMMRLTKQEVLKDLKGHRVSEFPIEARLGKMTPEDKAKIEELEERIGSVSADQALDILTGMSASISSVKRIMSLAKVDPIIKLVSEELTEGSYKKIVIFASHTETIKQLEVGLAKFGAVSVFGEIAPDERQRRVERFQTDDTCQIFIGNILAAGTNITLTAANEMIFVEQDWVVGNNIQAIARCDRIGQTSLVNVRVAMVTDSIDELVSSILIRKQKDIESLMEI